MVTCFNKIAVDSNCRSVVFSGAGKIFSAGCIVHCLTVEYKELGM